MKRLRGRVFSTGHLLSGLAVAGAAGLTGMEAVLLVGASVLADWDYPLGRALGVNHRFLITHSPLFWLPLGILGLFWAPAWWVFLGLMVHFSLDLFDLGLRLNPLSRRPVGLGLLKVADDAPFGEYLRTYYRTPFFLGAEVALALLAAAAWGLRLA